MILNVQRKLMTGSAVKFTFSPASTRFLVKNFSGNPVYISFGDSESALIGSARVDDGFAQIIAIGTGDVALYTKGQTDIYATGTAEGPAGKGVEIQAIPFGSDASLPQPCMNMSIALYELKLATAAAAIIVGASYSNCPNHNARTDNDALAYIRQVIMALPGVSQTGVTLTTIVSDRDVDDTGGTFAVSVTATSGDTPAIVEFEINVAAAIDITAFDAIADIDGGTVATPTYANAAAVIAALPTTVTANDGTITVPVTTWADTDTYNAGAAASYTFTATLGTVPSGYTNTSNLTATVEVVVAAE